MKMQLLRTGFVLLFLLVMSANVDLLAQCPMCKMTAESNLAAGGTGGKGLNIGILFMLSLPYVIIGSIGFVWWRKNRKAVSDI
jgi:hypothetical protein